jgi:hypothetical protein
VDAINKQLLQIKTAGKPLEQSVEINTATTETNCKETMTKFNPVANKVENIGILHHRIDNIEDSLRQEISNIVVELNIIPRHKYSRDYTSLLTKQKEDLTNYNTCFKQENDELRDRLNTMSLALSDLN